MLQLLHPGPVSQGVHPRSPVLLLVSLLRFPDGWAVSLVNLVALGMSVLSALSPGTLGGPGHTGWGPSPLFPGCLSILPTPGTFGASAIFSPGQSYFRLFCEMALQHAKIQEHLSDPFEMFELCGI